ncbi:hypothetical protein RHSIM_Rhsim10G0058900 [Rhododendron simsii]|uniref:Sulfotransferase n=1 Tax=Rhododendron simsii TaxID=118357 RepID=A0A834GEI4_RHOSS|nr:hypothetical protein RHSIM_Rhsim10G0058900 [Rhododendron simsii]
MEIQNHDFDSCFPKVKYWGDIVLYQFQGFWFLPRHLQGTKQVLDHFKPLPNDVILASFPKTGTTWLKALLYSVINRASINQLVTNHPHELVPSLEIQVYGRPVANSPPVHFPSNTSSSTRILSTHIPFQILSKTLNSSECRVIYVARNPKDTIISLWHFENSIYLGQKREPQPLEDIVASFCDGSVIFGPYFDHVLGYQKESLERPEKFFFITYEELKSDPNIHVKRLAEFLGCPFVGEDIDEQVKEVVRSCSIETLKKHEVNNSSDVPSWSRVSYKSLFRKGQVGDHMNYLTEDMIKRIDAIRSEKFYGLAATTPIWTVVFGPYFDHVLGYQKESLERPKKFFFITYEELKSDPITHVKRLAEFLDCPFVGEDMEKQVEEVVIMRSCSIETLKKHELAATTPISSLFEASLLVLDVLKLKIAKPTLYLQLFSDPDSRAFTARRPDVSAPRSLVHRKPPPPPWGNSRRVSYCRGNVCHEICSFFTMFSKLLKKTLKFRVFN